MNVFWTCQSIYGGILPLTDTWSTRVKIQLVTELSKKEGTNKVERAFVGGAGLEVNHPCFWNGQGYTESCTQNYLYKEVTVLDLILVHKGQTKISHVYGLLYFKMTNLYFKTAIVGEQVDPYTYYSFKVLSKENT